MSDRLNNPNSGLIDLSKLVVKAYEVRDTKHHAENQFANRVDHKDNQNPHTMQVLCGDSFCTHLEESTKKSRAPNHTFTGDNPGNAIVKLVFDPRTNNFVVNGTETSAYFMPHIVRHGDDGLYVVKIEAHTLCGAMNAILGGYNDEATALYNHLFGIESLMDQKVVNEARKLNKKDAEKANALLSLHNLDTQIEQFMKVYADIIQEKNVVVVGTVRDLTGKLYAPETQRRGDIFIANIDGRTTPYEIKQHPVFAQMQEYGVNKEMLNYIVRRI